MSVITITHRIADIVFATRVDVPLPLLSRGNFKHFLIPDTKPDIWQNFHRTVLLSNGSDSSSFSAQNDLSSGQKLSWRHRLLSIIGQTEQINVVAGRNRVVIRNFSNNELDFFYTVDGGTQSTEPEYEIGYMGLSYAPMLRQIFSAFLPAFSAGLIHSSAVIRNGLAALFIAPSGGGKTTVSQMASSQDVLSDDQTILRATDDGTVFVHSTPFGRVTSGYKRARLGGVFLLDKAESFGLEVMKPTDMLQNIWYEQIGNTYFLPEELRVKLYSMLHSACKQAPCFLMRFPKTQVNWLEIESVMK